MTKRKKDDFEQMVDALLVGGVAVQSTQVLTRPRTTANLVGTARGMLGIGIAGVAAKAAYGMVKSPMAFTKKRKTKRR